MPASWSIVRVVVGVVLVAASILKLAGTQSSSTVPQWTQIGIAISELFLGSWLLSGRASAVARAIAIVLFLAFTGWALESLMSGETTCGCFGALRISPQISVIVDAVILLVLILARPDGGASSVARYQVVQRTIAASIVVMGTFWLHRSVAGREVIVVDATSWIGQPCPLRGVLRVDESVDRGHWILLVIDPDCSVCQAATARVSHSESSIRHALISVSSSDLVPNPRNLPSGTLVRGVRLIATLPLAVECVDGLVTRVAEGEEVLRML